MKPKYYSYERRQNYGNENKNEAYTCTKTLKKIRKKRKKYDSQYLVKSTSFSRYYLTLAVLSY